MAGFTTTERRATGQPLCPRPNQHSLTRRKRLLLPPRLLTDHLREEAPSPRASSCDKAACRSGQKKGPTHRASGVGCGPAAPRGLGSHSGQGRARLIPRVEVTGGSQGQTRKPAERFHSGSAVHGQAGARLSWSPALAAKLWQY